MRIRFTAVAALCALACAHSAFAKAPLAVYYSFDAPVPAPEFTAIRSELSRILAPSGVSVDWISSATERGQTVDYAGLVVIRFRGRCGAEAFQDELESDPGGKVLAQTDIVEGHVLPFASVDCDRVKALIAPAMAGMPPVWNNGVLGRALARVSAHELYHMLAGVETHDQQGIFRPVNTRADLTAASFSFAAPELQWLRAWKQRQAQGAPIVQTVQRQTAASSDEPPPAESSDTAFAGR